jgi:hypothetical protein
MIKDIRDIIISRRIMIAVAIMVIRLLGLYFSSIGNIMPSQY